MPIDLTNRDAHVWFDVRLITARASCDVTLHFFEDANRVESITMTQDQLWRLRETLNKRCVGILEPKET